MHASSQENEERLAIDLSRRKHFRVDCAVEATLKVAGEADAERTTVLLRNIGLGGARVDSPIELPIPCQLRLVLPALPEPDDSEPLELDCRVAWTVAERDQGPYPTGLQILAPEVAVKARLFRYIAKLMR